MANRIAGPADNQDFYNVWLRTNRLFTSLILTNLDIPPLSGSFDNPVVPTMAYLMGIGKAHYLKQRIVPHEIYTYALGELLAPEATGRYITPQGVSRDCIIDWVQALILSTNSQSYTNGTRADYLILVPNAANDDVRMMPDSRADDWPGNNEIPSAQAAVRILYYLSELASRVCVKNRMTMLTHCYVSVLKRGTVSMRFLDKVVQGIQTDLRHDISFLEDALPMFYQVYGQWINSDNIQQITARWEQLLPEQALRLVLTVRQALGGGLTSFITIGRAMRKYPTFPWVNISLYYPGEWKAYYNAVQTVYGNRWYGFNKDLGNVKSTLYKSLSYVAKELLVKVNGEGSLNKYGGWVNRVAHQAAVDRLIADFENAVGVIPEDADMGPAQAAANELLGAVRQENNADIFG